MLSKLIIRIFKISLSDHARPLPLRQSPNQSPRRTNYSFHSKNLPKSELSITLTFVPKHVKFLAQWGSTFSTGRSRSKSTL